MKLAIVCALCVTAGTGGTPRGITGIWNGSFNGQPTELKPDGTYPETVTRFSLSLTLHDGKLNGSLTLLSNPALTMPINKTECDFEGCGFEVIDNADGEVFTWRVEPHGIRLIGNRNSGHMTPLGIGSGARLFGVRARKISK